MLGFFLRQEILKKKRQISMLLLLPSLSSAASGGEGGNAAKARILHCGGEQSPRVGDYKDRQHRLLITQTTVLWVPFPTHLHN